MLYSWDYNFFNPDDEDVIMFIEDTPATVLLAPGNARINIQFVLGPTVASAMCSLDGDVSVAPFVCATGAG